MDEPIDAVDSDASGLFAAIGIEKGKPFVPDPRMKKILMDAAAVGDATARSVTYRSRIKEALLLSQPCVGHSLHRWQPTNLRNGAVNLDGKAMFFFYAIGITPAMTMKMVGEGSQYAGAFVDMRGKPRDGSMTSEGP